MARFERSQHWVGNLVLAVLVLVLGVSASEAVATRSPSEVYAATESAEVPQSESSLTSCPFGLSQSLDLNTITGSPSVCGVQAGMYAMSFIRRFPLSELGCPLAGPLIIEAVEFAVFEVRTSVAGGHPIDVRLYTIPAGAPFLLANMALIGNATFLAPNGMDLTAVSVPVAAVVNDPSVDDLVVEIFAPDGRTTGTFFRIGSNTNGQTHPTWIIAPNCGAPEPVVAASAYGHMIMKVCTSTSTGGCGNGITEPSCGEACDDGNSDPADQCTAACVLTRCGDGVIQSPNGEGVGGPLWDGFEECDAPGTATCDFDCTLAVCGDGTLNTIAGEACDDGNNATGDNCSPTCQPVARACSLLLAQTADIYNPEPSNSTLCSGVTGQAQNSYLRRFHLLADEGISGPWTVRTVQFAIQEARAGTPQPAIGVPKSQPLEIRLYTIPVGAPLLLANLTRIGLAAFDVQDQVGTYVNVNVNGRVDSGATQDLVVEVFAPNGQPVGHRFWLGANTSAESRPTYKIAPTCGYSEPTRVANPPINFPDMHAVINVCSGSTCNTSSLTRVVGVGAIEGPAGEVVLSWQSGQNGDRWHVNTVATKVELLDPRRTGNGVAECTGLTCTDTDPSTALGVTYYQVLEACDNGSEGPF